MKNQTLGGKLWLWGIAVLVLAATFAVVPLVLHYLQVEGHRLSDTGLTTSHIAPTIAFGAVSGVLLSRARARDRSGQRARDLSVALGTMFVYSGQIGDEDAQQRFLHDMGSVVIESSLRQDAGSNEDPTTLLSSIINRTK